MQGLSMDELSYICQSSTPYHAEVEGVERLRAVERDDSDIVVGAEDDVIGRVRGVTALSHDSQRQLRPKGENLVFLPLSLHLQTGLQGT